MLSLITFAIGALVGLLLPALIRRRFGALWIAIAACLIGACGLGYALGLNAHHEQVAVVLQQADVVLPVRLRNALLEFGDATAILGLSLLLLVAGLLGVERLHVERENRIGGDRRSDEPSGDRGS